MKTCHPAATRGNAESPQKHIQKISDSFLHPVYAAEIGHRFFPPLPWVEGDNRKHDTLSWVEKGKGKLFGACSSLRSRLRQPAWVISHQEHIFRTGQPSWVRATCYQLLMLGLNPFGIFSSFPSLGGFLNHSKVCLVMFLSLSLRRCWQTHFLPTAILQLLNIKCCHEFLILSITSS